MRKMAIMVIAALFSVVSFSAGDVSTYWARKVLMGYDADGYYCMEYEATQQESDAAYYERIFWCKYTNTGVAVERNLARETKYSFNTTTNQWEAVETVESPLNIIDNLIENRAMLAFPMNPFGDSFYMNNNGVYCDNGYEKSLIVPAERIKEYLKEFQNKPNFRDFSEDMFKLVAHYSSPKTVLFVIQYGGLGYESLMHCQVEGNCRENRPETLSYQVIIPTPISELPRVRELIIHTVKKGDNLSKIAVKYGVTVEEIMQWNKLKNADHVFIGQKLKIHK